MRHVGFDVLFLSSIFVVKSLESHRCQIQNALNAKTQSFSANIIKLKTSDNNNKFQFHTEFSETRQRI